MIRIKVADIIKLFDIRSEELKHDITSIIGIVGEDLGAALFKRYYEKENGTKVIIGDNSPLGITVDRRRPVLDRWIYIKNSNILYQTEIKNWSANAIGGRSIDSNDSLKIKNIAFLNWQDRLEALKEKTSNRENKVFHTMQNPNNFPVNVKVRPLLIYWHVLSRSGKDLEPLFNVNINRNEFKCVNINEEFKKLYVFSMSNYLRSIRKKELKLEMPHAEKRINFLKKFFIITK